MFSLRQLVCLTTLIFGLLSPVISSSLLPKRLDSGDSETGGSAAVQYIDPKTNIFWIKNYHIRESDGHIVEIAYRSDSGNWTSSDIGSLGTGDRNGGLAAFAYISEADNTPVIHVFYDDLNTGYLKSVQWFTCCGWSVDTQYNSVASKWTNSARSAAAISFNNGTRNWHVFVTTSSSVYRLIWTISSGWYNENVRLLNVNGINRDIAVIWWWGPKLEISIFYAIPASTAYWNIQEVRYSASTNSWTTLNDGSHFENFHGKYGIGLAAVALTTTTGHAIRVYAQGDSYVELASDNDGAWSSRVLGNSDSDGVIRQGQISAIEWNPNATSSSIFLFQVKCPDTQCASPIFEVQYYDSTKSKEWNSYAIDISE